MLCMYESSRLYLTELFIYIRTLALNRAMAPACATERRTHYIVGRRTGYYYDIYSQYCDDLKVRNNYCESIFHTYDAAS